MTSHLKSFELHGYKTFASRTEFEFADRITAIVGPNGSGKSNIADAIRWVLGEQSYGLLRGKKTEDMIFHGSEQRSRAGMASATIVFDNSDGWLPIDFVDVGITRRAYRDGENEYLLNGQRVRLRDVNELLAQSGLAERTYTVIGQGLVDAALALKAEERRRLFEEAAGIGLYRIRREEALRRADTTQRNMDRVQDILAELQPRLRSLERQAKRAREYEQVLADLRVILRDWYGFHWHQLQRELSEAQDNARQQEVMLSQARESQFNLSEMLVKNRMETIQRRDLHNNWHSQLSTLHSKLEELNRRLMITEEREYSTTQKIDELLRDRATLQEEIGLQEGRILEVEHELEQIQNEVQESEVNHQNFKAQVSARQSSIREIEERVDAIQQDLTTLITMKAEVQARILELRRKNETNSILQNKLIRDSESTEQDLANTKKMLDGVILSLNRVEEHLISSESALAVHQKEKDALSHQAQSYQETLARYQANLAQVMAQLNVLEQAESSLSGYSEGVKVLLEEFHKKNKSWARGTLSNLVDVPTGLETAISVALGEFSDALIMRNPSDIDTALEILQTKSVRGSLLPLDEMKNFRPIQIDYDKAPVDKELILGLAWELVKTTEDLRPIIHVLLGHVLIVQDRNTAKRLLSSGIGRSFPYLRIVTINGELFHASGPVTGGASNQTSIHRKNKLKELRGLQQMLEPDIHEISEQIRTIYDDMVSWQTKDEQLRSGVTSLVGEEKRLRIEHRTYLSTFENHQRNLNWQKKQLGNLQDEIEHGVREIDLAETELTRLELMNQEKTESLKMEKARLNEISISDIQAETSYWATRMAVASRARDEAKKHVSELRMNLNRLQFSFDQSLQREQEMVAKLKALETDRLNTQSEIDSITIAVNELLKNIQPIEEEIHELEAQQSSLVSKDSEARQALSIAEHRYSQAKIIQANKQEAFNSLQKRIEDDLGLVMYSYDISISGPNPLPIAGMVQELPWVAELPADMDENINSQRALLRRIGPVNPEALVEFQQINERFEFLTQQVDDLKRAEAQIKEVITELDLLMEREFRKTFDAVAQEFRQIFTRLFGGGSARLVLTDPEEMTTTGIDIEARLPGRREQGLSLLSGGERSLTATALVFALLKVSPTPFCVLDEVDAMLDEANVGRFRDMLNELSEHTQFIVITHNRNTVQVADVIYGITMGRDSSSQVISLRMDEISEKYLR